MVNKKISFGMLVMVLAFSLAVVGCDNGTTNDNKQEYEFPNSISLSFDIPTYEHIEITEAEWNEERAKKTDAENDYFKSGDWEQFYDYDGGYVYADFANRGTYNRYTYWEPSDSQFNEIIEELNLPVDWEIIGEGRADLRIFVKKIRPTGELSNGEYWILAKNPVETLYKDSNDEIVESLSWEKILIEE